MKIANTLRQWLKSNAGVDDSATEVEMKGATAKAIREGTLTVKMFADLQGGDTSLSHVTPDMLFGSGDDHNGHKAGLSTTKSIGRHVKTGEPMRDERGREAMTASEHENCLSGAFLKNLAARSGVGVSLTTGERELLDECCAGRWSGKHQSTYVASLSGASLNVKTLLNDSLSGGVSVTPDFFDDQIVTYPLLHSEVFPFTDLRSIPRGASVDGAGVSNIDSVWGNPEGTEAPLFDTSALVGPFDTSIHAITVCAEIGRDFLSDAVGEIGRVLSELIGMRFASELDRVCVVGSGSGEPQGIANASGIGTVNSDNGAGGPHTLSDYESLLFGVEKQYRVPNSMRCAFISNDTVYRRSRGIQVDPNVTTTDQRRILGMTHNEYTTLGFPHRIQQDLANTVALYGALAKYRVYRRQGMELRVETGGKELARRNTVLYIARARYGGRVIDPSAFAKIADFES